MSSHRNKNIEFGNIARNLVRCFVNGSGIELACCLFIFQAQMNKTETSVESCDFGMTWTELDTGSESSISGGAMHDGRVLLAASSGTVLTRDDGREWTEATHSSGVDFAAAVPLDDGRFLVVGEDGVFEFPETVDEESSDE